MLVGRLQSIHMDDGANIAHQSVMPNNSVGFETCLSIWFLAIVLFSNVF